MEKLKLYMVDADYIKYLFGFDDRVMYWSGSNYKTERKYLGVVLRINDFQYFAPLSSPKESDYFYKNGKKQIRKNIIPIIRLVTDKGDLLGKVKLSNMISVKSEYITLYDIQGELDIKYKDLVLDEIVCIRKCKDEIIKNARILYKQKTKDYKNIYYLDYTIDFKQLELACLKYGVSKEAVEGISEDTIEQ